MRLIALIAVLLETYTRKCPDQVSKAQFEAELENVREVVASILRLCGLRLSSLAGLWTVLTSFRFAIGDENLRRAENLVDLMDGNPVQVVGVRQPFSALLHEGKFSEILHTDLALALSTLRSIQSECDPGGPHTRELEDITVLLTDAHSILGLGLAARPEEDPW